MVYEFAGVALTTNKPGDLKQQMYLLTVLEARSLKSRGWQGWLSGEALMENLLLASFWLLVATGCPCCSLAWKGTTPAQCLWVPNLRLLFSYKDVCQ